MAKVIRNPNTAGMKPKHNRKLAFSGIALTLGSLTHAHEVRRILRDEIEVLMISSDYLINAPFLWVGMVFRYGLKNEITPHYRRIDKKDGELELSKELDMRILLTADEQDPSLLKDFFEITALDCLIHAGKKYKLKTDVLEKRRAQLGVLPDWEYDMEEHPDIMIEKYLASKPVQ